MMRPRATLLGSALLVVALGSCDTRSQSDCHREMVERFACCPTCDGDCRAAITDECAAVHDEPLADIDLDEGTSDGGPEPDEPSPPAPQ